MQYAASVTNKGEKSKICLKFVYTSNLEQQWEDAYSVNARHAACIDAFYMYHFTWLKFSWSS